MCGIAGVIGNRAVNRAAVVEMTARLAHRGPDGDGIWSSDDDCVVFGHRRLAIIDPTPAGAQPMVDPSGRFVITFNGEIYNYIEIAERLEAEGVTFQSKSDTEVLLEAYKFWGEACLAEMNGMFAFAIYDADKAQVFFARDRFGEKPLLYIQTPDYFAFASEYKALFALEGVEVETDDVALLRFLHQPRQGLDDTRSTVFKGISQLLPGESLVLQTKSLETNVRRYWDVNPDADVAGLDEASAIEQFRDLLEDSVRLRMRSDVEVGSCLSGGLDSSSIVCLNRRILGDGPTYHTFTGSFPGTESDEEEFASIAREATGVTGHVTEPTAEGFMADLPDFIWFNELPVGSSSQYAQWSVFKLAKETGVTVLLDGQGADELLGGYEQYFVSYLEAFAEANDAEAVAAERARIEARYPMAFGNAGGGLKSWLPGGLRWRLANLSGKGSDFLFGISSDMAGAISKANTRDLDTRFNALSRVLKDDSLHAHLPSLLRYGDRNSMAHSREVRLPFCDHRLAEFVLSLSPEILMGSTETKHLLRAAMSNVLPEQIRNRWNKQGFLPPQQLWFGKGLRELTRETLNSSAFSNRGYWQADWWRKLSSRLLGGEEHLSWMMWRPIIAEAWQTHFVDRARNMPRVPVFE